jgi:predicted amidohydrolase
VANGVYVAACNRVGHEPSPAKGKGIEFFGHSFICGPQGEIIAKAGQEEEILTATIDYVQLHRILTGLTDRRLWERSAVHAVLADDPQTSLRRLGQMLRLDVADVQGMVDVGTDWLEQVRQSVPEEFLDWIARTTEQQARDVAAILAEVAAVLARVDGLERRDIAAQIADSPYRGMIFAALDGRPILVQAWAAVRPAADRSFAAGGEDVA